LTAIPPGFSALCALCETLRVLRGKKKYKTKKASKYREMDLKAINEVFEIKFHLCFLKRIPLLKKNI
jgi:hypothetical protein